MAEIRTIQIEDHESNIYYPQTLSSVVFDENGKSLDEKLQTDVPANAKFTDTVVAVADNLTTNDAKKALSAKQGKILKGNTGDLSALETTNKANIVLALNEIHQGLKSHKADFMQLKNKLPVATGKYIATNNTRIINIGFIPVFIVIYHYVASDEEYQHIAHFDKEDSGYYTYTGFSHKREGGDTIQNPHVNSLQYALFGKTENGSTGFILTESQEGNIIKYFAFGDVREVIK